MPVIVRPTALMTRLRRIFLASASVSPGSRSSLVQCRTIPVWLMVNEKNTPMM